ncbi:hypothetical protein [Pseudomonas edaphica]|uniref:hypothetical protein n=1 Tax=Pseudomonas edaphica TaxID=2006980 RepID=UPI003D0EBD53
MNIGNAFHTYNLNQITQYQQTPAKPEEKPSTTGGNPPENKTQSKSNSSSVDSLGQGNLW